MKVIYIDTLFLVNFIMDYFLLFGCGKYLKLSVKRWRLLLSAALGGGYACLAFLVPLSGLVSFLLRLGMAAAIVKLAFKSERKKMFFKQYAAFFVFSFLLGGGVSFLYYMLGAEVSLLPGGFYFDLSFPRLLFYVGLSYAALSLLQLLRNRGLESTERFLELIVETDGVRFSLYTLVDTGNVLSSSAGLPVIVAEEQVLLRHLPPGRLRALYGELVEGEEGRIEWIPFRALEKEGVLPAFKPQRVCLKEKGVERELPPCMIGMSREVLSSDARYEGLMQPSLLS